MSFRTPTSKSSSLSVPSDIGAVPSARRQVAALVRDWDLPLAEDTVETLELLAGEVIANAVVHTRKGCQITVSWDGSHVRLEAEDGGAGPLTQAVSADLEDENGRGLWLVDALAQAWGARPTAGGKVVWFEIGGGSSSTFRLSSAVCEGHSSSEGAPRSEGIAEPGCVLSGPRAHVVAT